MPSQPVGPQGQAGRGDDGGSLWVGLATVTSLSAAANHPGVVDPTQTFRLFYLSVLNRIISGR